MWKHGSWRFTHACCRQKAFICWQLRRIQDKVSYHTYNIGTWLIIQLVDSKKLSFHFMIAMQGNKLLSKKCWKQIWNFWVLLVWKISYKMASRIHWNNCETLVLGSGCWQVKGCCICVFAIWLFMHDLYRWQNRNRYMYRSLFQVGFS